MNKQDILNKLKSIHKTVSNKDKPSCRIEGTPFEARIAYLGKYKLMLCLKDTESGFTYIEISNNDWALSAAKLKELKDAITYYMYKLGFDGAAEADMEALKQDYIDRLPAKFRRLLDYDL